MANFFYISCCCFVCLIFFFLFFIFLSLNTERNVTSFLGANIQSRTTALILIVYLCAEFSDRRWTIMFVFIYLFVLRCLAVDRIQSTSSTNDRDILREKKCNWKTKEISSTRHSCSYCDNLFLCTSYLTHFIGCWTSSFFLPLLFPPFIPNRSLFVFLFLYCSFVASLHCWLYREF